MRQVPNISIATQYGQTSGPFWDECYRIRVEVFVDEQKFPLEIEQDEDDDLSFHFLMKYDGISAATGRICSKTLTYQGKNYNKIGRIAVLKPFRRKGLARRLLSSMEEFLDSEQAKLEVKMTKNLYCHSLIQAKQLYLNCGFQETGEVLEEDGVDVLVFLKEYRFKSSFLSLK